MTRFGQHGVFDLPTNDPLFERYVAQLKVLVPLNEEGLDATDQSVAAGCARWGGVDNGSVTWSPSVNRDFTLPSV